jgi:phosphoribosylformylglycinamidine (FGAM) synthase-like enzyme
VVRPGGDAAVVRVHGSRKALAVTSDCTPRYCAADPVQGGRQAVAEAWRNLTAVGARPLAVTDCLNFGNPERPEIMGQLVGCIQGMGEACIALDFPVISGNVSLYNETNGQAIPPTPTIGGVGLLDDVARAVTIAFKATRQALVLIGETRGHFGASLYLREIEGCTDGAPPPVDLAVERRNGEMVRRLIDAGRISACHDVSDGGLLVALAEMAMAGEIGADIQIPEDAPASHAWLFGEDQARYVLSTDDAEAVLAEAAGAGVPAARIGTTGGGLLTVNGTDAISITELKAIHEGWLPDYMSAP